MKQKVYKYNDFLFSKFDDAHDYMVHYLENTKLVKVGAGGSIYATQDYKDEIKKIEDIDITTLVRGKNFALAMDLLAITETIKVEIMSNENISELNELIKLLQIVVNRAYSDDKRFYG